MQKSPTKITPILLINLDSRPDRLASSRSFAESQGFGFTRISAINGAELNLDRNSILSPGAIGCYKSHLEAYKIFIKSGASHALILEDDLVGDNFGEYLRKFEFSQLTNVDVLQVGYLNRGLRHKFDVRLVNLESRLFKILSILSAKSTFIKKAIGDRMRIKQYTNAPNQFIPDDFRSGCHSYFISKAMAKWVLEQGEPKFLTIDSLFGCLQWAHHFQIYRLRKSVVGQTDSPSSIVVSVK
jgi:GR25 family glycosyltransferase involved in LPS biosynthesis